MSPLRLGHRESIAYSHQRHYRREDQLMQIPNSGNPKVGPLSVPDSVDKLGAKSDSNGLRIDNATTAATAQSRELATLLSKLQETPKVRDEVVAAAKDRLSTGAYLTRDAAERTAQAILGSNTTH